MQVLPTNDLKSFNVLQVASALYDWGGIERYVRYLEQGLGGLGHQVVTTCPPGSPLDQRLTGLKVHLSTRRKHDLKALAAYLRLMKAARYDVVHVHFNPDFLVAGIAARLTKQPCCLLTRHVALPWSAAKVRMYGSLFDHIIPVSDAVERVLAKSGIPRERMTVAKAGCPALTHQRPVADVRAELGIGADEFAVGTFGRLSREKGIDLLFEASEKEHAVSFQVFGKGPLFDEFQRRASDRVRVHGFRTDVDECMAAMDAVVIPSRWEEAFPFAALEAMSLGKPLLVSRVGGLLEMVEVGRTGLAFERDDADGLARAAGSLALDRAYSNRLGAAGQDRHLAEFTVEKMAERISACYQRVAAGLSDAVLQYPDIS